MSAVSVVTIDVRDKAFKDFNRSFARYQAAVAAQPSAWAKVQASFTKYQMQFAKQPATWGSIGKAANALVNPFTKMAAAASVMTTRLRAAPTYLGKMRVIGQSMVGIFDKIGKSTLGIAKSIGRATLGLLKWASITGIIGGLLGGGSLFGLDRLAGSASNIRRESQGLGLSAGDLKSARINFSKFVDVDSTLGNIADARSDLSRRWIFSAMGVDPTKGSNVDVMSSSMKSAKHIFEQGGMTQQGAEAHGLTQLFSMDDLRRLHAMTDREIDDSVRKQRTDRKSLDMSDKTLKSWQDLQIQLDNAGSKIESMLINKLVKLAGPIGRLSDAFTDAVGTLLDNPDLGRWIDTLADNIRKFAKYLSSDDFKSDFDIFIDGVKRAAHALGDMFDWIVSKLDLVGIHVEKEPEKVTVLDMNGNVIGVEDAPNSQKPKSNGAGVEPAKRPTWSDLMAGTSDALRRATGNGDSYFADIEKQNSLPAGLLRKLEWQESRYRVDAVSPKGAMGPFQFMPATAKQYGLDDPYNLDASAGAAGRMLKDLMKKYDGDVRKSLAAYNWGGGDSDHPRLDADIAKWGKDWLAHAPQETQTYVSSIMRDTPDSAPRGRGNNLTPKIVIENNTGGNASVTTNALAF